MMSSNRVGVDNSYPPPEPAVYDGFSNQPPPTIAQPVSTQPAPYHPVGLHMQPVFLPLPENAPQDSYSAKCPNCVTTVSTETETTCSKTAWIMCCMCATAGAPLFWLGCACLPFCCMRDTIHKCPRCKTEISPRYIYENDPRHMTRRKRMAHGIMY